MLIPLFLCLALACSDGFVLRYWDARRVAMLACEHALVSPCCYVARICVPSSLLQAAAQVPWPQVTSLSRLPLLRRLRAASRGCLSGGVGMATCMGQCDGNVCANVLARP
jgi:hypothetical protein